MLDGLNPSMIEDEWVQANFLCVAPPGTVSFRAIPIFLQSFSSEGGAIWLDEMSVALSANDPVNPIINGGFDRGVDYNYQVFPYFNGWSEQYGNIFFDDFNTLSPPFSAGMYGNCLSEPIGAGLKRVLNVDTPLAAIAEQISIGQLISWSGDDQDIPDARLHQGGQWVINHRFIEDGH